MAIGTEIQLQDRMSGALNRITASLYSTVQAFQSVDSESEQAFNPAIIQTAAQELYFYDQRIAQLEADLIDANNRMQKLVEETHEAREEADLLGTAFNGVKKIVAALGIGYVIKEQVAQAVEYASDLTEVQNVVDVVFGDNSVIDSWAQSTLGAFGLSELSAKRFAGTMGAMLESSGLSGKAVEEMSMRITELAGDMASFYNLDAEEAFGKIRSGISGETEPLKQLGINMSVANLEAYALSQGITKAYSEMSQAEQVALRYNYLLQATANAQGDFANTSDSYSNQVKLLGENWTALTGSFATNVLPVLAGGISMLNGFISVLAGTSEYSEAFYNVLSVLAPILGGVVGIMGVYLAVTKGVTVAQTVLSAVTSGFSSIQTFLSIGWGVLTGNAAAASAAQSTYNSALLACPITWIIMLIIALIAIIYGVVAAINAATGSTISATGIIVGAVTWLSSVIANIFMAAFELILGIIEYLVQPFVNFANFLGNVFTNPVSSIIYLFQGMLDSVLNVLENIASAMDLIFGTNMADTLNGWRDDVRSMADDLVAKYAPEEDYSFYVDRPDLSVEDFGFERFDNTDAFGTGYAWGESVSERVGNFFGGNQNTDYLSGIDTYGSGLENFLYDTLGNVDTNISAMNDSVNISNENLKYLKDSAEQETINQFTTAEIKLDMTNNNNIASSMDVDGIITQLTDGLREAMESAAEGVYA